MPSFELPAALQFSSALQFPSAVQFAASLPFPTSSNLPTLPPVLHRLSEYNPSLSSIVACGVVLATLYVGCCIWFDSLQDIPGPFLARWTSLWLAYHVRQGRRFKVVHAAHKRYGPVVRISPNHISVADADALPLIYGMGDKMLDKSQYYDAFVSGTASVFSTRDRADHSRKRRLASHAFSIKSLQSLAPFVHARVEEFVEKLDAMCGAEGFIDTMQWFNYLAFDIISDLAFGEHIGMVGKGSDAIDVKPPNGKPYVENAIHLVDDREHLAAVMGVIPSRAMRLVTKFLPDPFFIRGRKSSLGIILMARQRVMKRIDTNAKRDDILNKLIEARMKEGDGVLSEAQITELTAEAVTILIAGSHTASSTTAAILHMIKTNPPVLKRLTAELSSAIGYGEIPTYEKVKDLAYLQATITEGLRHHGTNAIGLPRIVGENGLVCCGQYLPPGTEVSLPAWTLQHDEAIWGDPYNFRPDRWLETPELRRYLLTFGGGSRTCLGKHLVNMEMLIVLATFMLRYEVDLKSDVLDTIERFQHEPRHMFVRLRRKPQAAALG